MSTASFLKAPTINRLPELLAELKTGALRIPPFQRDFVWEGADRLLLLDSIRQGLPTGSLMVWRTSRTLRHEREIGPFSLSTVPDGPSGGSRQYLLDGRQRMTTLFAALGGALWTSEASGDEKPPIGANPTYAPDETPWAAGFDLGAGAFLLLDPATPDPDAPGPILPLDLLLDDFRYDAWRVEAKLTREQARLAREVRSAFVDYLIPVVPLATDDLEVVTRTFKRVNSAGATMGDLHMARALVWSESFDLIQRIDQVRETLAKKGWREIDPDLVLKVVAAAAGLDATEFDVEKLALKLSTPPDEEGDSGPGMALERAEWALQWSVYALNRMGFRGPSMLPAIYALVLPAAALLAARAASGYDPSAEGSGFEPIVQRWLAERLLAGRFGNTAAHMLRAMQVDLERALGVAKPGRAPRARRYGGQECRKFNLHWARSRVVAAVLGRQGPRDVNDTPLDGARLLAERGSEVIPQLLVAGAPGLRPEDTALLRSSTGLATALAHPANRIVALPEETPAIRALLLTGSPSPAFLQSHLIRPEALVHLRSRNFPVFFEDRREAIRQAELAWAQQMGVTSPSIKFGPKLWT